MPNLTVYLADLPGSIAWPSPIRLTLLTYFQRVVAKSGGFTGVAVQYSKNAPALNPYDLLVYFVESQGDSVVKALGAFKPEGTGFTRIKGKQVGAEVYLAGHGQDDQRSPKLLANSAFHELMHNTCLMGNELHAQPGVSLGRAVFTDTTLMSAGDIALVARCLKKERQQWTYGYTYYRDPLR